MAAAFALGLTLLVAGPAAASIRHRHHTRAHLRNQVTRGGRQAKAGSGQGTGGTGLGVTGGQLTSRRARRGSASPPLPGDSRHLGDRVLRPGMSGHDVRVLQDYLTIAGFPTAIDGYFGSQTEQEVKNFQAAHGWKASGVVTIPVEKLLRSVIAAIDAVPAVGKARINADGTATAPVGAPPIVQQVIAAANRIIDKPYVYGGGHGTWNDVGYDCSGSVSYALHGAGLLSAPEDSTELESYGSPGPGHWITIYADSGHTWIVVAGIAFDTADYGGPDIPGGSGPRWRWNPTGNLQDGGSYVIRHPAGL